MVIPAEGGPCTAVIGTKIAPGHRAMSSQGPSEGPGVGSALTMPTDDAIFIPLCGLRKAMVIPAEAGIHTPQQYWARGKIKAS